MGRRRTVGEARSAGAGRPCRHPARALAYQLGWKESRDIVRCTRCGQAFLAADFIAPPAPYRTRGQGPR